MATFRGAIQRTTERDTRVPTVLRSGPYRFYFYSHEPNEPPHVHVDRDDDSAKFWLHQSVWRAISDSAVRNFA